MLSILKDVSIVCKMLYTRNCSVLKRRRNGKMLLALLVFVYVTYLVAFANIEVSADKREGNKQATTKPTLTKAPNNDAPDAGADAGAGAANRLVDEPFKHEPNHKKDDYQIDQPGHLLPRFGGDPTRQMWANYQKIKDNGKSGAGTG